jgi:hypothetical protein
MRRLIEHDQIGHNEFGHDEDELNRILSREDEILPSSGFTGSVMDAVRREVAAPPPIPFPWKRAMAGLVVGGLALAMVLVAVIVALVQPGREAAAAQFSIPLPSALSLVLRGSIESAAIWTVLALLLAFVSVKLSMRIAFGRA